MLIQNNINYGKLIQMFTIDINFYIYFQELLGSSLQVFYFLKKKLNIKK